MKPASWSPDYDAEHVVTASDLICQAGITYRQMDYWVRTGRLTPVPTDDTFGSGYPRHFPLAQVRLARTMRQLLDAGVTVPVAHTAAQQLIDHGHADLGDFTLTPAETTSKGDRAS